MNMGERSDVVSMPSDPATATDAHDTPIVQRRALLAAMGGLAAGVALTRKAAAGPLNPPAGPVTSTHKTLTEIEPRIAVNATNTPGDLNSAFRISQPGSYYLMGNITGVSGKHGIKIEADGVTLDLNGFTVAGVPGSLSGIFMPGFRDNVVVRNGHVRGWGGSGLSTRIDIGRIEHISAANNGGWGIDNASDTTFMTHIVSCDVRNNGALVAFTGGIRGATTTFIKDCLSDRNTGVGILAGSVGMVVDCVSHANTGHGIVANNLGIVRGCVSHGNTGDGIEVAVNCLVVDNLCASNGAGVGNGANIHAVFTDNRIEGNSCTGADRGIDVDFAGNVIIRNTCSGGTVNWDIVANNVVGPILDRSAPGSAAILGNSAPSSLGTTDPHANFTY